MASQPFSPAVFWATRSRASVEEGISQSPWASAAWCSGCMKKSMNAAASSTCSLSAATDMVCGLAAWAAPAVPARGGRTAQLKPSGADSVICWAT